MEDTNFNVISSCMLFKAMRLDSFSQRMSTDKEKRSKD